MSREVKFASGALQNIPNPDIREDGTFYLTEDTVRLYYKDSIIGESLRKLDIHEYASEDDEPNEVALSSFASGMANTSLTVNSFSSGAYNIAGVKGWKLLKKPQIDTVDSTKYVIELADVNIDKFDFASDDVDYTYSVYIGGWFENLGTITGVSEAAGEHGGTLLYISNDGSNWPSTALSDTSFLYTPYEPLLGEIVKDACQHAEGYNTKALVYAAHAEGNGSIAAGRYSHAEGNNTYAVYSAHAEGQKTKALGQGSHAEGYCSTTTAHGAHAEGYYSTASGIGSHAEGGYILSGVTHSGGTASGMGSHAEGEMTSAEGRVSHAEGYYSNASGMGSHAEGGYFIKTGDITTTYEGGTAIGLASHAEGQGTTAEGTASHAEGSGTQAKGHSSHAEGRDAVATGQYSHAEGYSTRAVTQYSHAEGNDTEASGDNGAHAEGLSTIAKGNAAHAEGSHCEANAIHSHAEGRSSIVEGDVGHAEGSGTQAKGSCSHSQGLNTVAYGYCSHAGGNGSTATGECSFAHGHASHARFKDSFALGFRVETAAERQTVVGAFNARTDGKFLVGVGASDSALATGLRVDDTGNVFIKANLFIDSGASCNSDTKQVLWGTTSDDGDVIAIGSLDPSWDGSDSWKTLCVHDIKLSDAARYTSSVLESFHNVNAELDSLGTTYSELSETVTELTTRCQTAVDAAQIAVDAASYASSQATSAEGTAISAQYRLDTYDDKLDQILTETYDGNAEWCVDGIYVSDEAVVRAPFKASIKIVSPDDGISASDAHTLYFWLEE